jgi:hypothetical protein
MAERAISAISVEATHRRALYGLFAAIRNTSWMCAGNISEDGARRADGLEALLG